MRSEIILIAIAILIIIVGSGAGILGYQQGEIDTKNLLYPQIDKISQENIQLKTELELIDVVSKETKETITNLQIKQDGFKESIDNLIEINKDLKSTALDCYWAYMSYDYESYVKEYFEIDDKGIYGLQVDCENSVNRNFDLLKRE